MIDIDAARKSFDYTPYVCECRGEDECQGCWQTRQDWDRWLEYLEREEQKEAARAADPTCSEPNAMCRGGV